MIDAIPAVKSSLSKEVAASFLNWSAKSYVQLRSKDCNVMLYDISEMYKLLVPRLLAIHSTIPSGRTIQEGTLDCRFHLSDIYAVRLSDLSLTSATIVLSLHRTQSIMVTQNCV